MTTERNRLFSSNVERVARLAEATTQNQPVSAKLGRYITSGFGTMASVIIHVLFISGWVVMNSGKVPNFKPFDPYPFNLLTLIVSFEGVLIALFVLLGQNSMSRNSDLRSHLNLQMEMLIEQEVTAVLTIVKRLGEKHGITEEPAVNQLLETTNIEDLHDELEKKLPGDA